MKLTATRSSATSPGRDATEIDSTARSVSSSLRSNNKRAGSVTGGSRVTSAIFRVPADATDLTLPAEEAALKPYLFADGTRNAFDLKFAPNGDLIAAGSFTTAGGVTVNRIARWDGSTWSALGTGMNNSVYARFVKS